MAWTTWRDAASPKLWPRRVRSAVVRAIAWLAFAALAPAPTSSVVSATGGNASWLSRVA